MPELPEVEIIKNGLNKKLKNQSFVNIEIKNQKSFQGLTNVILNKRILSIKRRAKLIWFNLEGENDLIIHLKMTGQLIYQKKLQKIAGGHQSKDLFSDLPNKHTRVIFKISNNGKLYFNDLRKFGWIRVMKKDEIKKLLKKDFGPEPFSAKFNQNYLFQIIKKSPQSNIKKIIMDQKKIAGIGNMYADESLFDAEIDPQTLGLKMNRQKSNKLYKSILKILKMGIKYQGITKSDFVNSDGKKGKMQNYLKIYGRKGEKCLRCGGEIEKIKLNGRGTYFCPKCQR